MSTRATLRTELKNRLGDPTNAVWTDTDLNGYIANAIGGLYPTFHLKAQGSTFAGFGPQQTGPAGVRNIYAIDCQLVGSARTRPVLGWSEGPGGAVLPVSNITNSTLIWSWTKPFTPPTDDVTALDLTPEAEEVVILRSHVAAIEHLLTSRVKQDKYFAVNLRQAVSENDLGLTLDALHQSLEDRIKRAPALPDIRR